MAGRPEGGKPICKKKWLERTNNEKEGSGNGMQWAFSLEGGSLARAHTNPISSEGEKKRGQEKEGVLGKAFEPHKDQRKKERSI